MSEALDWGGPGNKHVAVLYAMPVSRASWERPSPRGAASSKPLW